MALRRGKARSVEALGQQVAEYRRLEKEIEQLDVKKRELIAQIERQKKGLEKRQDRLKDNIGRFYHEDGQPHFKKGTKTIFTRFGSVVSKASTSLNYTKPKDVVIDNVIHSGRVREFLSVQLKEGALKKSPAFAKWAGADVETGEVIVISPPTTQS